MEQKKNVEKGKVEKKTITSQQKVKFEERKFRSGDNRISVSIGIGDMPLSLYKEFTKDSKDYNDIYWVKIQDLMRKAEAYDLMLKLSNPEQANPLEDLNSDVEEMEKEKEVVQTLGGPVEIK